MLNWKYISEGNPVLIGNYLVGSYKKEWDDSKYCTPVCTAVWWDGNTFSITDKEVPELYRNAIISSIYCYADIDDVELPDIK